MGFAFEIENVNKTGFGNALLNGRLETSSLLVGDLVYVGYNMSVTKLVRIKSIKKDYGFVPAITTLNEKAIIEIENEDGTAIDLSELAPGMSLINSKNKIDTLKDKKTEKVFNLCKKYAENAICCDNAKIAYLSDNNIIVSHLDKVILAGLYVNNYCIVVISSDKLIISEIDSGIYRHIPYNKITKVDSIGRKITIKTDNGKETINSEYILSKNFSKLIREIRDVFCDEKSFCEFDEGDIKSRDSEKRKTRPFYIPNIKGNYGLSDKYDRKKYEDKKAMNDYKDSYFDGKKMAADEYTGQQLHADAQKAKNKYGTNKYTTHTAETDHIEPIKGTYEKCKKTFAGNLITDEQFANIVNDSDNFAVTNAHINRSMGAKPKKDYVRNNGEKLIQDNGGKIADKADKARKGVNRKIRIQAAKNVGGEVGIAALEAGLCAIPDVVCDNYRAVKNGEKTKKEAFKDGAKEVMGIGAEGGLKQIIQIGLEAAMKVVESR
jgi:hypothetical protein